MKKIFVSVTKFEFQQKKMLMSSIRGQLQNLNFQIFNFFFEIFMTYILCCRMGLVCNPAVFSQ